MNMALTAGMTSLALTTTALAGGKDWQTNMDAAMKVAQKDGKMLLIDFTGSDWCGWCIKLNNEVFSQEEFKSAAPKDFVLVELDFPARKPQTDEVKAHNQKWHDKYGVEGYPTIVLADPAGEAFALTGYRPDGPDAYVSHLQDLLAGKKKRDEHLEAAKAAEGIEKAKRLDDALSIEGIVVPDAVEVMDQIIALDADNAAGLRDKYQELVKAERGKAELRRASGTLNAIGGLLSEGKMDEALVKIDAALAEFDPSGELLMQLVQMKVSALYAGGKTDQAVALLDELLKRQNIETFERQVYAAIKWQVLMEGGDADAAAKALQEAIAIDPESEVAEQLRTMAGG